VEKDIIIIIWYIKLFTCNLYSYNTIIFMKDMTQIKSQIESLDKESKKILQTIKASITDTSPGIQPTISVNVISELANNLYDYIDNLRSAIWKIEDNFYNMMSAHKDGHLPPINGPEKMNKALSVLGLDGDYQVEKRTIYASKNRRLNDIEVTLVPTKKS
jgi:hypothetical protein